jgi:transposase
MKAEERAARKPELRVVGLELVKSVLHLVGMDERGKIIVRQRLARGAVRPLMAKRPRGLGGMEACGGTPYGARQLREQGHEVQWMAPPYVQPYTYCMSRRNFFDGK